MRFTKQIVSALCGLLLLSTQASAAWAFKGAGSTAAAASVSYTIIGAGNLLVATCYFATAGTQTAVTDTKGNTWTQVLTLFSNAANGAKTSVYYAPNTNGTGADTVNCNTSGAAFNEILVTEYSGLATTTPIDGTPIIAAFTTGYNPSVTAGAANELVYVSCISSTSCGCPTGFTSRAAPDAAACDGNSTSGANAQAMTGGGAQTDVKVIFLLSGATVTCTPTLSLMGVGRCG